MTDSKIDDFKKDIRFKGKIAHIEKIPRRKAKYKKIPNLNLKIKDYLSKKGIKLYEHQVETYEAIKKGKNVIITTPTASGKTLAFNLPILETFDSDNKATALYIYPVKALSSDQLDILKRYDKELNLDIRPNRYDGDTEKSRRYEIRNHSRAILTNPYQIHHILAWHHQWKSFYKNLKYIVIDESHYYRGIFGSNVAFLIRRLKRIVNYYGANPQFILSSATLANPLELANKLTGEKFTLIDNDKSPSGEKDFILYNPYIFKKKFKKNKDDTPSIHQETEKIFLFLLLKDIQTLCFTVSRKTAELIAMWSKKDIQQIENKEKLANRITAYRAGYLPEERREIEEGLKSRRYLGVTCTNALELGINIGTLDAVIISGFPGTMTSTWQQGGRSGRGINKSLVILVAFQNQLDQYFMNNPSFFFDKPHENVIIDLKNKLIQKAHIICAASELPLSFNEAINIFKANKNILDSIVDEKNLFKNPVGFYMYPYDRNPSFIYSLDSISDDNFKIMSNKKLLEVMDRGQVYREAHEGAVLINKGETYIVDNINLNKKFVNVTKKVVDYHTMAFKEVDIKVNKQISKNKIGNLEINYGELTVSEEYTKYKKMHFSKTLETNFLNLPPLIFKTRGLWFTISNEVKEEIEEKYKDEKQVFAGGLHGTEHALISLFPLHVMCDRFDIGGLSTNHHPYTEESTIFIYDAFEGGIGIAEKACEVFADLIKSSKDLLENCDCEEGCPSCIYSPKCGNDNKPLHKEATKDILSYLNKCISNKEEKEDITNDIFEEKSLYDEAYEFYLNEDYVSSKDLLVDLINNDKDNDKAFLLIGKILLKQEESKAAIQFAKKALSINPNNDEAYKLISENENF